MCVNVTQGRKLILRVEGGGGGKEGRGKEGGDREEESTEGELEG